MFKQCEGVLRTALLFFMRHSLSFLFSSALLLGTLLSGTLLSGTTWANEESESPQVFRVCADPNNLPFSNQDQEGFENKIAEVFARELGQTVDYTWHPQRRGFLRNTLNAGKCDVVMGMPADLDSVLTTRPYYRSSYAFVYPEEAGYQLSSLDDPVLKDLRIGVHLIGDDYTNSPPAHALSSRGIVENVVGYSVFGDYAEDSPPGKIVAAVASKEIDTAIIWGPIAGYFAKKQAVALHVSPVPADADSGSFLFAYDIALGVRRNDEELRNTLNRLLDQQSTEIHDILIHYGIPLVGTQRTKSPTDEQTKSPTEEEAESPTDETASEPQVENIESVEPTEHVESAQEDGAGLAKLNPYTGNPEAIAEGEELYKLLNCYSCHGLRGGGGMGPNLTDEQWKEGTGSDIRVMGQVMTGRNKMPGYDGAITEDEAWKVIAYVRTLYKGDPSTIEW